MICNAESLKKFSAAVMQAAGLPEEDSTLFAESLVGADMRGVSSHGVTRLTTYYARIRDGLVDKDAEPEIVAGLPSLVLVNGNNAMGVKSAAFAMRECITRAKTYGGAFAAVYGGNHFGYAAFFSEMAAKEGMIGIALANGPAAIPPIGGKEPVLGTNPIAISVPRPGEDSITLDMATSVVARGKIALAAKEGKEIPEDWGIDENGLPTTDPNAVKCVLPFGGAKGFGIGLVTEILCSALSGAGTGLTMGSFYDFSGKQQNSGFFVGALNPASLNSDGKMPGEWKEELSGSCRQSAQDVRTDGNNTRKNEDFPKNDKSSDKESSGFDRRVEEIAYAVKGAARADGCREIFLPGEIEAGKAKKAAAEGVSVSPKVWEELRRLSEETGVPLPALFGTQW